MIIMQQKGTDIIYIHVNDIGPKFLICPSIHPLLLIRVGGGAGAYFSYHSARGRVHS